MLAMGAPQAVVVTMRTGVEPRAMVSSGCGGESAACDDRRQECSDEQQWSRPTGVEKRHGDSSPCRSTAPSSSELAALTNLSLCMPLATGLPRVERCLGD